MVRLICLIFGHSLIWAATGPGGLHAVCKRCKKIIQSSER